MVEHSELVELKANLAEMSREDLELFAYSMAREQDRLHEILRLIPSCPEHGELCSSHAVDWIKGQLAKNPKADPMDNHKCRKIAECTHMDEGRAFWIGELLEPIEGYPHETHCIHVTTPTKSVVFGVMHGDAAAMAVAAQIIHKDGLKFDKPINPRWIDLQEAHYRAAANVVKLED